MARPQSPAEPRGPADFVLRFLESVSSRSETDFYLGLFRALPKERFAAISVSASVGRYAMEAVVLDLRYLAALGLFPVVVLGLFDNAEALEHAGRIRRRLEREGISTQLLSPERDDLPQQAATACTSGALPIVAFARDGASPWATSEQRIEQLGRLLSALQTRKMIFLDRRGGLLARSGPIEMVNLTADYEGLMAARDLSKKQKMLVVQSRRLVFDLVPHRLVVAVTSPLDLLRELFTVKGAGTLLRRGAQIVRHEGLAGVDQPKLRALIERSFGRPACNEFFERPVARVYREEGWRGAAIVADTPLGGYLTKFAVEREAQGEGIGRDLWEVMAADYPSLFWRARPRNPIAPWYARLAHGLSRFPEWTVYWRGIAVADIPRAIEYALEQPTDIPPEPPADGGPSRTG